MVNSNHTDLRNFTNRYFFTIEHLQRFQRADQLIAGIIFNT